MKDPIFLSLVAEDLTRRFGNRLADVTVVFPGRRARLFFNQYLYREIREPIWAPQYLAIDELFENLSSFRKADMIQLTGDLYHSYIEVYNAKSENPSEETLDEFFFFGEILLNDFDDIDKNLVNAKALFRNLQDLDRLKDDFNHLSDAQREEISRRFGKAFSGKSELKESFGAIWNILGEVYSHFREKLVASRLAYPGMLMREVVENKSLDFSGKQYVFVGFNVLSKCEEMLFKRLENNALFYWDYDEYYLKHEAGQFLRENIRKFGSALENQPFDVFLAKEKEITLMAASSESGQTGIIPFWLDSLQRPSDFTAPDSAIVLCNEAILPVVMHSVSPAKIENVNITMGFPIAQTPVAGFLHLLTEMQTKAHNASGVFYYKYVLPVLRHPYTRLLFPEAEEVAKRINDENLFFPDIKVLKNELLFTYSSDTLALCRYLLEVTENLGKACNRSSFGDVYDGLYQESIFRAYQVINRLYGLQQSGEWKLEKPTFLRLMRKLLSVTQVPFHGEPVKGLQIMGLLETRTLDFKNLLLLSVNEGFMPGSTHENSFIPRFLRKELGLSTVEHEDSIYAYYFFRLLQRAEKITLVYNIDRTQTGKAEMSRFLLQLLIDRRLKISRYMLQSTIKPIEINPVLIPKTNELISQIKAIYDFNTNSSAKRLTPSNLNIFIDCSLKFYYRKIKGYEPPEEMSEELDASVFGSIFHRAAELLYIDVAKRYGQKADSPFTVEKTFLDAYLQSDSEYRIGKFVAKSFEEIYFKGREVDESQYNGEQLINYRVICAMLKRLIEFDHRRTPFTIIGLEWKNYDYYTLEDAGVKLKIGGIIDRLEERDGKILILDYKTGGFGKTCKKLEDLVTEKENRASHIFQTFVYASVLIRQKTFSKPIVPALIYMQEAGKEDYSPIIQYDKQNIDDFRRLYPEFESLFLQKISELFNPDIPFQQTAYEENCKYCEFKELCNR
jgi:RecB family exonuclease